VADPGHGQSASVQLNGVSFTYSDVGEGAVVLYAHGLTSSRANDERMGLADFSLVGGKARLIAYDARGHGQSSGTADIADYTWSVLADDMIALADHFSPDAPVTVIGSSMGTGTALHAAVKRPERFARLVLTAPPTAWETRSGQSETYAAMAEAAENTSPEGLAQMLAQAPMPPIFEGTPGFPAPPDVAHALLPTVLRGAGASDLPPADAVRALEQPTLILAWATDPGHPVSSAEKLHSLMSGSQLHISTSTADIASWGARAAAFLG
jgi:3-oxoadipate enol-lactonase